MRANRSTPTQICAATQTQSGVGNQVVPFYLHNAMQQLIACSPILSDTAVAQIRAPSGCASAEPPRANVKIALGEMRCPSHAHPEHEINPPPLKEQPASHTLAGVAKLHQRRRPIINSVSAFALLGGTNGLMRGGHPAHCLMQPRGNAH